MTRAICTGSQKCQYKQKKSAAHIKLLYTSVVSRDDGVVLKLFLYSSICQVWDC